MNQPSWTYELPGSSDIDEPLNEAVADKICDYRVDYNNRIYQLPEFFFSLPIFFCRGQTSLLWTRSFHLVSILGIPVPRGDWDWGGEQEINCHFFVFSFPWKKSFSGGDLEINFSGLRGLTTRRRLPPHPLILHGYPHVTMTHDRYGHTTQYTNGTLTHRLCSNAHAHNFLPSPTCHNGTPELASLFASVVLKARTWIFLFFLFFFPSPKHETNSLCPNTTSGIHCSTLTNARDAAVFLSGYF